MCVGAAHTTRGKVVGLGQNCRGSAQWGHAQYGGTWVVVEPRNGRLGKGSAGLRTKRGKLRGGAGTGGGRKRCGRAGDEWGNAWQGLGRTRRGVESGAGTGVDIRGKAGHGTRREVQHKTGMSSDVRSEAAHRWWGGVLGGACTERGRYKVETGTGGDVCHVVAPGMRGKVRDWTVQEAKREWRGKDWHETKRGSRPGRNGQGRERGGGVWNKLGSTRRDHA